MLKRDASTGLDLGRATLVLPDRGRAVSLGPDVLGLLAVSGAGELVDDELVLDELDDGGG